MKLLLLFILVTLTACSSGRVEKVVKRENSLSMTLVPVPCPGLGGYLWVSDRETTERQMSRFRSALGRKNRLALPNSAATHVSWREAQQFCGWLTQKERESGKIRADQSYRLPTDHEWSCAVGIGQLENPAHGPERKSNRLAIYPWGASWPPPRGAGNYCGEEAASLSRGEGFIQGYRDTQALGAGSSPYSQANALHLHDLGGNVWEWCSDLYRPGTDWRVLRGGAWTSWRPQTLSASHRTHDPEHYRSDSVGFRVVLTP